MKKFALLLILIWASIVMVAQSDPFQIHLKPLTIPDLPGIQAFAFGQHEGQWLIVGGRIDGLHRRQPWATFDSEGRNTQLYVVDPNEKLVWNRPLTSLPLHLQDQLSSTNMEFLQQDSRLYLVGGYGHSETVGEKLTYAMLTAIDLPATIEAVKEGKDLTSHIRSITDPYFAVTGGHLEKINDVWHLVGGQKFDGNYNPMNHPSFTQEYTNGVKRFTLMDDGVQLIIEKLETITDTAAFHRRDYNVGAQITPEGEEAIMSFSGPFRIDADLPYLNTVMIEKDTHYIVPDFAQYFNNYHCPVLPLYDEAERKMHTVFFGGIAQYYLEGGKLTQDNGVPFVKTIARIERDQLGNMAEFVMPIEMPGYLGASAEFIPAEDLPRFNNRVLKLNGLQADSVMVGYIFGGIESTLPNIFWTNTGTESAAHPVIYEVYLIKNTATSSHHPNDQSHNGFQLQVFPNPTNGTFTLRFHLDQITPVQLEISDDQGKRLLKEDITHEVLVGENRIEKRCRQMKVDGVYFITLMIGGQSYTQKIIARE